MNLNEDEYNIFCNLIQVFYKLDIPYSIMSEKRIDIPPISVLGSLGLTDNYDIEISYHITELKC